METGTDRQIIRRYRLPTGRAVCISLLFGLPGISLIGSTAPDDDLPLTFRTGMLVLIGSIYLLLACVLWSTTIVYQDHIAVRLLFRTRRTIWSDVLSIETDENPAPARTLLLDRKGRLFPLLGGVGAQAHEVRAIKDIWERSRGEDWSPPAEATVLAAQHRTRAHEAARGWAICLAAGSLLVLVLFGIFPNMESDYGLRPDPVVYPGDRLHADRGVRRRISGRRPPPPPPHRT